MIHRLHASPSCDSHVTVMSPRADEPRDELSAGIARHMAAVHAMAPDACITRSWRQHTATDTMCGRTFHGAARRHTGTPPPAPWTLCTAPSIIIRAGNRLPRDHSDHHLWTVWTLETPSHQSGHRPLQTTTCITDHHMHYMCCPLPAAASCTHATGTMVRRNFLMVPTPASCMCVSPWRDRACVACEFVNPSIRVL